MERKDDDTPLPHILHVPAESKDSSSVDRDEAHCEVSDVPTGVRVQSALPTAAVLDKIKAEHDQAKAVKSDDAQVPRHHWDEQIFPGPVSEELQALLDGARGTVLKVYVVGCVGSASDT